MWSSLSQLCDRLHVVREQSAACDEACAGGGGGGSGARSTSSHSVAVPLSVIRAALLLDKAAESESCGCGVCDELCLRQLTVARGVQALCVQRAVDQRSAVLVPSLSSWPLWSSLLTDLQPPKPRVAARHATHAVLSLVQQLVAASVRSALQLSSMQSDDTLSHFLFDDLFPALHSFLSSRSDDRPPPSRPPPVRLLCEPADPAVFSAVVRAVPRPFVYRLLASACVAAAERCVGHSWPDNVQQLWRDVLPIVDLSAPSVPQLARLLSLSSATSLPLPLPLPLALLTVSSYAAGRFSLVRSLISSSCLSPTALSSPIFAANPLPSAADLLSSTLSLALDVLASLSSVSAADAAAVDDGRRCLRLQCGEFILFALMAVTADQRQQQRRPQHEPSKCSLRATLPPLRAMTEQLMRASAAGGDEADVDELIHRAFIAMVAAHTHTTHTTHIPAHSCYGDRVHIGRGDTNAMLSRRHAWTNSSFPCLCCCACALPHSALVSMTTV